MRLTRDVKDVRLRAVPSEPTEYNGGVTLAGGTVLAAESRFGVVSLVRVTGRHVDGGGSEKWDMDPKLARELSAAFRMAADAGEAARRAADADGAA